MVEDNTIRMITRVITFGWRWWCYDERVVGDEDKCSAYESDWNESPVEETGYFPGLSRDRWADEMKNKFEELIKDQGEKDCQDITAGQYLHLCKYEIVVMSLESRIGSRRILEKEVGEGEIAREKTEEIEVPVAPVVPVVPVVPVPVVPVAPVVPAKCPKPIKEMLALFKDLANKYTGKDLDIVIKEIIRIEQEYPGCKSIVDKILGGT